MKCRYCNEEMNLVNYEDCSNYDYYLYKCRCTSSVGIQALVSGERNLEWIPPTVGNEVSDITNVIVGRVYKHFKGDNYIVEDLAKSTKDMCCQVVYRSLYGTGDLFVIPLSEFVEDCTEAEVREYGQKRRFQLLEIKSCEEGELCL